LIVADDGSLNNAYWPDHKDQKVYNSASSTFDFGLLLRISRFSLPVIIAKN